LPWAISNGPGVAAPLWVGADSDTAGGTTGSSVRPPPPPVGRTVNHTITTSTTMIRNGSADRTGLLRRRRVDTDVARTPPRAD
jgi:hypothetical protein